jgi:hypothetical protein
MSTINGFPTYSIEAQFYLDELFFLKVNDINFFFEDENHESFYERLLEKIFPSLKINKVFCLGGKGEVLKKCKENQGKKLETPNIYIVDKDFDDLLGKIFPVKELIYLPRYSIENFLFDSNAFISVLLEELKGVKKVALESELKLQDFYINLINQLNSASRHFVIAQKYNTSLKSTKLNHSIFIKISDDDGQYHICNIWTADYQKSLLKEIQHFKDITDLNNALSFAFNPDKRYESIADKSDDAHVCGKYILSIVWDYVSKKKGLKEIEPYSLSMRLLDKIDINKFNFLKDAIATASAMKT